MSRTTQLIQDLEQEVRILDHCDRVDREMPLFAEEDWRKARNDSTGRAFCRQCKTAPVSGWGCSLCWKCRTERASRNASAGILQVRMEKVG